MSLMDQIIESQTVRPPKIIIYGSPGVGKTTFAAQANSLLIDCENGANNVKIKRTPYLSSWKEIRAWIVELASTEASKMPDAVSIDTLDWLVQRIIEHVTMELDPKAVGSMISTLAGSHGGYFKAREIVNNIVHSELLPMLNHISESTPIIMLAHAANVKMTTPEGFDMRTASPDIPQWIAPVFIEWADAVLYATKDGDSRKLITENTNVVLAKNRFGLPPEVEMDWNKLVSRMVA